MPRDAQNSIMNNMFSGKPVEKSNISPDGSEYMKYAKYSDKSVAIYNPTIRRWEAKLHFRNRVDRDTYFGSLDENNKGYLSDG